jgi:adenylate kinase family enzyme
MRFELGQRIAILGNSGSGKSTLTRALGAATGVPLTHFNQRKRPRMLEGMNTARDAGKTVIRLRSPQDVRDFPHVPQKSTSSL